MKRTGLILMAVYAIGLCGCISVKAISANGDENKQIIEGDKYDVKPDTKIDVSPNNPNPAVEPDRGDPLSLLSWHSWDEDRIIISEDTESNKFKLSSNGKLPDAAGIVNANLSTSLRGKTIILYFSNTKASKFDDGLMVKVECDNKVLQPTANALPVRGFLTAVDTPPDKGIEFTIPNTFNGKLNFVFYQADLKDLKISVFYK